MAPRYRELATIDIPFSLIIKCDSCGAMSGNGAEGWQSRRRPNELPETIALCPECGKKDDDG